MAPRTNFRRAQDYSMVCASLTSPRQRRRTALPIIRDFAALRRFLSSQRNSAPPCQSRPPTLHHRRRPRPDRRRHGAGRPRHRAPARLRRAAGRPGVAVHHLRRRQAPAAGAAAADVRRAGYRGEQRFNLAAVVEFIHTATLLHDDVVDESTLRRGRPTANESFGNPASVLVGDFLYSRAFQMMLDAQRHARHGDPGRRHQRDRRRRSAAADEHARRLARRRRPTCA